MRKPKKCADGHVFTSDACSFRDGLWDWPCDCGAYSRDWPSDAAEHDIRERLMPTSQQGGERE